MKYLLNIQYVSFALYTVNDCVALFRKSLILCSLVRNMKVQGKFLTSAIITALTYYLTFSVSVKWPAPSQV